MSWVPFGMEEGKPSVLVDGVPDYMKKSLVDWMMQAELLLCCGGTSIYGEKWLDEDTRYELIKEFDRRTRQESHLCDDTTNKYFEENMNADLIGLQYTDYLLMKLDEDMRDEQCILVVPEKLRTLDHGRPWSDDQFASTRLSSNRDMSR